MKELKVRVTFTEEILGMTNSNPKLFEEFIASKAPDAMSKEEEIASLGVDEVVDKGTTVFPKMEDGTPFLWDYQIKGFFKDSAGMLRKVKGTKTEKLKAYKKEIDGLIFVYPRKIPFTVVGELGECSRPLRAVTMQGERNALAKSETIADGSSIEFTIKCMVDSDEDVVREWLDYGSFRGMGQWRNSGKGRFEWEEIQ